ncbi:putative mediator of RNA polymerase II transcription subunit 26, partial [Hyalella azteca]|uniref:Mediator of RNA polymerase II transcription subunit 26 n=1 Tax=Hyalella azteca TaxID=294128 RepID=A0A979FG60_HYAAZ
MLNLDEQATPLGSCPSRKGRRRNNNKKKRSRDQTPAVEEPNRPDHLPSTSSRRRRGPGDQNSSAIRDAPRPKGTSASRLEELRLYMDKLRELVPHKHDREDQPEDLIQKTIAYICELQKTLENHPRLQGLDPRVIAAPGNALPPMEMQQLLLQQRKQLRLQQLQQQYLQQLQQQPPQQQQRYHQMQQQQPYFPFGDSEQLFQPQQNQHQLTQQQRYRQQYQQQPQQYQQQPQQYQQQPQQY